MLPRTKESYGAPYINQKSVEDPTAECDADLFNILCEDAAQMTRVVTKVAFEFATVASGTATVTDAKTATIWGTGAGFSPVVTRTGIGLYTCTFAASYPDGFAVAETVSFVRSKGFVSSLSVSGRVQTTESANIISLVTLNAAGSAADLTAGTIIRVEAG